MIRVFFDLADKLKDYDLQKIQYKDLPHQDYEKLETKQYVAQEFRAIKGLISKSFSHEEARVKLEETLRDFERSVKQGQFANVGRSVCRIKAECKAREEIKKVTEAYEKVQNESDDESDQ